MTHAPCGAALLMALAVAVNRGAITACTQTQFVEASLHASASMLQRPRHIQTHAHTRTARAQQSAHVCVLGLMMMMHACMHLAITWLQG